jgi:hypothetical protein
MLEGVLKQAKVKVTRKECEGVTREFFGAAAVLSAAKNVQSFAAEQPKDALFYVTVAAPALHTTSSCDPVPPEQPIAPISFPFSTSGIPPRKAIAPSSVSM